MRWIVDLIVFILSVALCFFYIHHSIVRVRKLRESNSEWLRESLDFSRKMQDGIKKSLQQADQALKILPKHQDNG